VDGLGGLGVGLSEAAIVLGLGTYVSLIVLPFRLKLDCSFAGVRGESTRAGACSGRSGVAIRA
jgi:hypothetical protein